MKRTRRKSNEIENVTYDGSQEPIVLSKIVIDLLMSQQAFPELLALYTFYYYTAKWQHTNKPKASVRFTAKALHWDPHKVIKLKKQLKHLGLVEDVKVIDKQGKIKDWYTHVHFIWTKEKIKNYTGGQEDHHGQMITTVVDNQCEDSFHQNALRTNNKMLKGLINNNNSSTEKSSTKKLDKNKIYLPIAKELSLIIQTKKNIKHTPSQIAGWADDIRKLKEQNGVSIKRMKIILNWYEANIGGKYIPVVESGKSFREKFLKLEAAKEREDQSYSNQWMDETAPEKEYEEGERVKIF